MAQISAALVKELREKTGAGMMECKSALTESDGNIEDAIKVLRKKGLAAASKKAGRITSEGLVYALTTGGAAVLVEMNCETDFVAKTEDFQNLVREVAELVAAGEYDGVDAVLNDKWPGDAEQLTVGQVISSRIAKTGENMSLRRFVRFPMMSKSVFGSYVHAGGKIGVLVELEADPASARTSLEPLAKEIAMHIAATEPRFLRREEVTEKDLETEREIARDQALKSGKPEAVVDKITAGKMEKFYSETVLLEQPYIRDDKLTVSGLVEQRGKEANANVALARFTRFRLGEGLQKRADDFAAEVMAQAGT